ncbi:MAG: hypothetical protein N3F65_03205 [Nitrososphaeria archaeon]|nr:hypothetical protein [Aigarchaeota archaeon]MCX8187599.1 hypothetical protein [Nitrososphaeria archaeon]MDW8021267.1 hypothetical protein [Nitrososphaerota archaeon]
MNDLNEEAVLEERIAELEKDLRFCENMLNKEARIELARRILEDLMEESKSIPTQDFPEALKIRIENLQMRIRILYHRANALLSLQQEG